MKKHVPSILRFHGVRGSRPAHAPQNIGYGGNSTCIEFDPGLEFTIIIDGGSGLQHISQKLGDHPQRKRLHVLISHTHWDHVLQIPFLKQFNNPEFEIHFYAPDIAGRPFSELFSLLFKPGRLPVPALDFRAKITFHKVQPGVDFLIEGKVKVSSFQVNHQHITLGYKLSYGDSVVAIITDAASIKNGNYLGHGFNERAQLIGNAKFETEYNAQLVKFLGKVPTVVFNTHFNQSNLKADWGHATPEIAIEICAQAAVRQLFMFHHAPEDDDNAVAKKQMHARNLALPHGIEVINAREEDEWPLKSA